MATTAPSKAPKKTAKTAAATTPAVKTYVTAGGLVADRPQLPVTLRALQFLVTARGKSDGDIFAKLDQALSEAKSNDIVVLLERVMLHVGDVSRQHNLLREMGIASDKGGAQERQVFRAVLRWWAANLPESFDRNLRTFAEFTNYENLFYYQNTTDRKTGRLQKCEVSLLRPASVQAFLAQQIRAGRDLNLIAKHLPAVTTGKQRTQKKAVKAHKGKSEFLLSGIKLPTGPAWMKLNGVLLASRDVTVKAGDVLSWPRAKQEFSLEKQQALNQWVNEFCGLMGWDLATYKAFRSQQDTPEQKFASQSVRDMAKSEFQKMLDGLTSGQRFRVAKTVAYKDAAEALHPHEKWGELGNWYIEWEQNQEKVADALRDLATQELSRDTTEDKAKLMKEFKVKATGVQTVDMLAELFKGQLNETQVNNTYQKMVEQMDLIANVFPVVDGSGSMDGRDLVVNGVRLTNRQIAYAMAIAFSTRNPVPEFRNTFGWFSRNFHIVGKSNFVDNRPNQFVARANFVEKTNTYNVLSEAATFTQNFEAMRKADPRDVASTNPMAVIEHMVGLVKSGKMDVESLPQAILYISDNEFNTGMPVRQGYELAASIGWSPLQIFWGITELNDYVAKDLAETPNVLTVSGFNEGRLGQVLRGIKSGSIDPQDELWTLFEDKRYSVIQ